jgi:hypothetical protein
MPPRITPPTARTIRIEDIDRGVKSWFEDVLAASVNDQRGETKPVTVKFGSGERWVAAADKQGVRDKDGRLILPLIQIAQLGFDTTANELALGTAVPRLTVSTRVADKTSAMANLDASRPLSQRKLRDSVIYDVYTIPFPVTGKISYQVRIQTQFVSQFNTIQEKFLYLLDSYSVPSFVVSLSGEKPPIIKQGAGPSELIDPSNATFDRRTPAEDYYVVAYLQGDISDGSNLEEFTDQERIIQHQFSFYIPTALMLDPEGARPSVQKQTTAFGVTMGDENVTEVDSSEDMDRIFGPR